MKKNFNVPFKNWKGEVITDAKDEFDQMGSPVVSMKMNTEGARKWAQMTKK